MINGALDTAVASVGLGARAGDLEDDRLEFKSAGPSVKSTLALLADAAVCFANAGGGDIVVGIDDRAVGTNAFVGVPAELSVDVVRKGIYDRTRPSLTCFVVERQEHGARLLVVSVPQGVGMHANTAGTATRRLGNECLPFSPDQQREVLASRGLFDWSSEVEQVGLDVLDGVEVERLRGLLRRTGRADLAERELTGLLRDLRLIDAREQLTRTAVVLLAREDVTAEVVPDHGYSYQYRATQGLRRRARSGVDARSLRRSTSCWTPSSGGHTWSRSRCPAGSSCL